MRLMLSLLSANVLEMVRYPAYSVATLIQPSVYYLFFASLPFLGRQGISGQPPDSHVLLASFVIYSVLSVLLYQYSITISTERNSPWEKYLRLLPSTMTLRYTAKMAAALPFILVSTGILALSASVFTHTAFSLLTWTRLLAVCVVGAVPFALLGVAIGVWSPPRAAVTITNLIFLPMAYLGGLWVPPKYLPQGVQSVSELMPTRHYAELAWGTVFGSGLPVESWAILLVYSVLFGAVAALGYRRDKGSPSTT